MQDRAKELAALCFAGAGSVQSIFHDAMQDVLGGELVFWKTVAAIRARRTETLQ